MRVPRVFVDLPSGAPSSQSPESDHQIQLSESDARHVVRVLRLTPGRSLIAIDRKSGAQFEANLTQSDPATIRIDRSLGSMPADTAVQALIFALCRGGRNEFVIEKATELGAREVILFQSERSTVVIKASDLPSKIERFQKVAEAAAKQCRRADIPTISVHESLSSSLLSLPAQPPGSTSYLYLSPSPNALPPTKIKHPGHPVHLLIGPEGGLSTSEESALYERGFTPLSLGQRILRAETAAVAAMAVAQALWA